MATWQISIDTGGTFTDCLALDPAGRLHRTKVLSTGRLRGRVVGQPSPQRLEIEQHWGIAPLALAGYRLTLPTGQTARVDHFSADLGALRLDRPLAQIAAGSPFELGTGEPGALVAARLVTATPADQPLPPLAMRLGTTRGTNALLERRGAPTALVVSAGFADLLEIGDQQRPEIFALEIRKPKPLYRAVLEVDERIAADGTVLRPIDLATLRERAGTLLREGITTAAVALVNSYRNPAHEVAVARLLAELGFTHVSCSAELSPLIKLLPRAETALVNAYLAPLVGDFLCSVARGAGVALQPRARGRSTLLLMTSGGGLMPAASYRPKDSLLSGPAGGVVGAALAGERSGFSRVISFDMGGTSTDVARWDGEFDYRYDQRVGDVRLAASVLAIETVASGGGSICAYRHGELRVGPASAGAAPGPACYGAGGPLTLTDVNLLLGRLRADRFGLPVDLDAARQRLAELSDAIAVDGQRPDEDQLLEGLIAIANERMAGAIRRVSLRRGYQPGQFTLVAFGGAGPQHACGVARQLGIETVVVPADAGLLSAMGIGHAPVERIVERQLLWTLDPQREAEISGAIDSLCDDARAAVVAAGIEPARVIIRRRLLQLRFIGQDAAVDVAYDDELDPARAFERQHIQLFGHRPAGRAIEVVSARVIASAAQPPATPPPPVPPFPANVSHTGRARLDGRWLSVPCYDGVLLRPGAQLQSPAIVFGPHSTALVEPGWRAEVDAAGALVLRRPATTARQRSDETQRPEAVRLELFSNRLAAIAEEMGEVLRRTALSTNVKERLDFSCALLDAAGELVVNAPHIPVHLGSLGLCVREVVRQLPLRAGDVAVTNHPAYGGSHLPDVTVISPVFVRQRLLGYVASRAHHAEIGGSRPGSMPPGARCLAEEGVVIPPRLLVGGGEPRYDAIAALLSSGPWPSRAVGDNLADLRAAVAANHRGVTGLAALTAASGVDTVERRMSQLRCRAEREVRRALAGLPPAKRSWQTELDDGTPLCVSVEIDGDRARIDFAGSGAVHPGNLNATPAVVRGAVIYVLRLLIAHPLPLNEGLMEAVELSIPPGLLAPPFDDDPRRAPAVVGGNVETSQRLVDILLQALGLAACSQGTMNNLLFGTAEFGYYETICGGSGAGPGFAGAHAVQTHMTNTRITDVEVLEHRYPVRVERFARRRGSGGAGRLPGGDGVVRELVFLREMTLSLLSQRRRRGPAGLAGGGRGLPGKQHLVRGGTKVALGGIAGCEVGPGDRLRIETPGGGGYGEPSPDPTELVPARPRRAY